MHKLRIINFMMIAILAACAKINCTELCVSHSIALHSDLYFSICYFDVGTLYRYRYFLNELRNMTPLSFLRTLFFNTFMKGFAPVF